VTIDILIVADRLFFLIHRRAASSRKRRPAMDKINQTCQTCGGKGKIYITAIGKAALGEEEGE
jgi:hypothetical protein